MPDEKKPRTRLPPEILGSLPRVSAASDGDEMVSMDSEGHFVFRTLLAHDPSTGRAVYLRPEHDLTAQEIEAVEVAGRYAVQLALCQEALLRRDSTVEMRQAALDIIGQFHRKARARKPETVQWQGIGDIFDAMSEDARQRAAEGDAVALAICADIVRQALPLGAPPVDPLTLRPALAGWPMGGPRRWRPFAVLCKALNMTPPDVTSLDRMWRKHRAERADSEKSGQGDEG